MLGAWCRVLCRVLGAGCCAGCRVLCGVQGDVPGARGMRVATASRMGAKRYQDLAAWQLSDELKKKVYALVDGSGAREDRRFCDQIKDSAASAPRNLAEGFACYRHPEFARYVRIAKSSLTETHNHLGDGVDRRYWKPQEARSLQDLADRAIGASVRLLGYLESSDAPNSRPRRRPRRE